MGSQGSLSVDSDPKVMGELLVPSPCSEAVTHELEELSLQHSPSPLPLTERKNVLQLRLQQRRTREQLVDQGIMPPLKTPAAFHEQIRSLERARTGNFLKHKICSRPERSELVRMHILQETQAVASLQATQMKLKRARLTDDLNEKLAQRPGPMELVVKNILPVDTGVKEAVIDSKESYTKTLDVYNFDEDSSDALSPDRPASQESQSSACTPPREHRMPEPPSTSPGGNSTGVQQSPPTSQSTSDAFNLTKEQQSTTAPPNTTVSTTTTTPGPVLIKQSQPKTPGDKNRSKKSKEPKPRVKKLKYHQYIPPDQKQELSEMPMDSAYACLLQQQQQFLQLQILSQQQQQHFSYQAILPAPLKSGTNSQNSCPQVALNGNGLNTSHVISLPGAAPGRPNCKPDHLPANLEEMKVAELKLELKCRGLPVSGTKTDLIERLRSYQENCNIPPANANATDMTASTVVAPQSESMNSSPPVSPIASKVSGLGTEESGVMAGGVSPSATSGSSPQRPPREEESPAGGRTSEKDKRLHEKELQIEELRRKLEQEQRLVEELRMQLEVEKRNQQGESPPPQPGPPNPIQVKVEKNESPPHCTGSCSPPGLPMVIKQDPDQSRLAATHHQFMISHQQVNQASLGQPEPQLADHQPGTGLLLPGSPAAAAAAVTIQLPDSGIELQPSVSSAVPDLLTLQSPGSGLQQKTEASAALQKHCTAHTQPITQTGPLSNNSPGSGFPFRADQSQTTGGDAPQHLLNDFLGSGSSSPGRAHSTRAVSKAPTHKCLGPCQPMLIPKFVNHGSKSKDPPCYEDAVKQTRSMHIAVQVPSAASQHMDDLFDVLIESGEISPFTKPDLPSLDKLLPVTASVTTLPINTVLSRPPPQIQVAQLPVPAHSRPSSLVVLAADGPLETLLGASLVGDEEPRTLRLMEELLEHPSSPMDYTSPSSSSSSFHLQSNNLDNMEWLDLSLPAATGELNPLGVSSSVGGVFSEDFLDSHELQLNWD